MSSLSETPLGMRLDAVLDEAGKRIVRRLGLINEDLKQRDKRHSHRPTESESMIEETPVNPLRHWRWE